MEFAIVDIETTGGNASQGCITEVSIYAHDGKKVIDHFTSLFNPNRVIPRYITALTGIDDDMVAQAPQFAEHAGRIAEILKDRVFIAHSVNFDYSFLKTALDSAGHKLNSPRLCSIRLARKIFPQQKSYSLGNLCRSLEILITDRHRADGDAKGTVLLFEKMLANNGHLHIKEMLRRTSAEQWLPHALDKSQIDRLPPGPGVYYFHDAGGKIIYVGKAVNLRKRVVSHFMPFDGEYKRQHFIRLITEITYKECATELHALILESTEIKRLWPRFNRAHKQPTKKYALYGFEDRQGLKHLAIDVHKKHVPCLYSFYTLAEGQAMLRKMMAEYELHNYACHFGNGTRAEYDESIDVSLHNSRMDNAVENLLAGLSTFAIMDEGVDNRRLCLLMERGVFWGMGYVDENNNDLQLEELKEKLDRFPDNDFIRLSLYNYAASNPHKKIDFSEVNC